MTVSREEGDSHDPRRSGINRSFRFLPVIESARQGTSCLLQNSSQSSSSMRSGYFAAGSINVRSVSGSRRFCIVTEPTVTITSSVGDT
jgi:hypothetical protein